MDTPDNIKYGNMTAGYRMRYKQMLEQVQQEQSKKKSKKKETLQERMSRILYGGSSK
tara:strand:- start:300 stop:470 length:171 start_codon:yes stop_codon:yes gene_type:complete